MQNSPHSNQPLEWQASTPAKRARTGAQQREWRSTSELARFCNISLSVRYTIAFYSLARSDYFPILLFIKGASDLGILSVLAGIALGRATFLQKPTMDLLPLNITLPPKVRAMATSRRGGVSDSPHHSLNLSLTAGDDAGAVYENRMRLNAALPSEPAWLRQAHGNRALLADKVERDVDVGDAAYTAAPGVVCAALSADCLPVLFFAEEGEAVAAAHAGWRGLAAGILENTAAALQKIAASPIHAIFGAAISAAHYEVGADTRAALLQTPADDPCFSPCTNAPDKWHANLRALATRRLQTAGVSVAHDMSLCTYAHKKDLFSVRRDGERTGRQATLIFIDG